MDRLVIADRPQGLEDPPTPSKGRVTGLDFEYRSTVARDRQSQRCQSCDELVRLSGGHVRAVVRFESGVFVTPVYCSRECWVSWAKFEE